VESGPISSTVAPQLPRDPHLPLACAAGWEFIGKQEYGIHGNKIRDAMNETDEEFWQRLGISWLEGTGLDFHKTAKLLLNLG
jgi:hypothetical protein